MFDSIILVERCSKQIMGKCDCSWKINELSIKMEGETKIIFSKKNSECIYYPDNLERYNISKEQYNEAILKSKVYSPILPILNY